MRKLLASIALALAIPGLALAQSPNPNTPPGTHGKAAPKVMYVLRGTLSKYTRANGATNGTITILVQHANHHGAALKGQTLTIAVSSATRVVVRGHGSTIADGDTGMIKVRAPKSIAATDLATTFSTAPTVVFQIVDQHPVG